MADRPNSFDTATPSGASSPRSGDDEIRRIKEYTQNGYNDLTQPPGVGIQRTDLYGATVTGDSFVGPLTGNVTGDTTGSHNGVIGDSSLAAGSFTTISASSTVTATGGFTGDITGDVTGSVTGDVAGNSNTASALATARTISLSGNVVGSGTFDGSGNLDITTNLRSGATIPGNVETAARWDTGRSITLSGAVTGSVTGVDGSTNIAITTAHGTLNTADIDDVTATAAEINRLDLAANTQLGIIALETDSGNADPVIGDFSGNITLIGQY